jgi:hypothetical protein
MQVDRTKHPPWDEGQKVVFGTFDDPDADTRDLDGMTGVVVSCDGTDEATVKIDSPGYDLWLGDPYALLALKDRH